VFAVVVEVAFAVVVVVLLAVVVAVIVDFGCHGRFCNYSFLLRLQLLVRSSLQSSVIGELLVWHLQSLVMHH